MFKKIIGKIYKDRIVEVRKITVKELEADLVTARNYYHERYLALASSQELRNIRRDIDDIENELQNIAKDTRKTVQWSVL